jgi:hypothetical protein
MEQSREQPETTEERMTAAWVVDNFGLDDARVVAVYLYGSRVYGTHSAASDWVHAPSSTFTLVQVWN